MGSFDLVMVKVILRTFGSLVVTCLMACNLKSAGRTTQLVEIWDS